MLTRILLAIAAATAAFALSFTAADRGSATPAAVATPTPIEVEDVAVAIPHFEPDRPVHDLAPQRHRAGRHRPARTQRGQLPSATATPRPRATARGPASPADRPHRSAPQRAAASPGAPVASDPAPAPTAAPAPPPPQDPVDEEETPAEEEAAE